MFKRLAVLLFAVFVTLLGGCATVVPLRPEIAKNIKTVYVTRNTTLPPSLYFKGSSDPGKINDEYARQQNIYIDDIIRNQFIMQLASNTPFQVIHVFSADAKLYIYIKKYGLIELDQATKKMAPIISVEARMVNDKSQIIWQDSVNNVETLTTTATPDEIMKNPSLLAHAWTSAAKKAVAEIVNSLPKK